MMMADARNTSIVATARRMWATGGLPGLWRGNMISVVKVMPQSAIQFAVLPLAPQGRKTFAEDLIMVPLLSCASQMSVMLK